MAIEINDGFLIKTNKPADSRYVKATLVARDAIPAEERYLGLTCYVESEETRFILKAGITNADWEDDTGGGKGGSGSGSTLNLCNNPSFELEVSDDLPLEWGITSGTLEIVETNVLLTPHNTKVLKAQTDGLGSIELFKPHHPSYQGTKGCFSLWILTDAERGVVLSINGVETKTIIVPPSTKWQQVKGNFTFGNDTVALYVSSMSGNAFYIDEVFIGAGEVQEDGVSYISGDSSTDGSWRFVKVDDGLELQVRAAGIWTRKGRWNP